MLPSLENHVELRVNHLHCLAKRSPRPQIHSVCIRNVANNKIIMQASCHAFILLVPMYEIPQLKFKKHTRVITSAFIFQLLKSPINDAD